MKDTIKISATVYWAFMNKPNDLSGKYQVDLGNLSTKAVQALEDMGIEVKDKGDDRGKFITCKKTKPIMAFDEHGEPIQGVEVGNGSKAVALMGAYEWSFKNKKGMSPSLIRLVVTDLVEYEGAAGTMSTEDAI